jgi:group I intron endonuclease
MEEKEKVLPDFSAQRNKCGIYLIRNTVNNHCYVGQSIDIENRWIVHLSYLRKGYKVSPIIKNAYEKYGEEALSFEVIEYCLPEQLNEREQYYMDTLKPEYNIAKIAGSSRGIKRSKETLVKMSAALKGIPSKRKGKQLPEEHKQKIAAALKGNKNGQHVKPETREKLRASMIGNTYAKGKTHETSPETREKIRQGMLGKINYSGPGSRNATNGRFVKKTVNVEETN